MANTYKNIVITPNIGNTAEPRIQFSGGNTTANTDINLYVYPTSNGTLSFEGSAGQLFSITNDLSNLLFSVADVSGIPSLEVYANGLVSMIPISGNIVVGNTTTGIVVNTTNISSRSNATVNSTVTPALLQVANSTATTNVTALGLTSGISVVNTTVVAVGSNNFINATALDIGNTIITTTNTILGGTIAANGGIGSAGQVLTSGGAANAYWTTPTTGTVTSVGSGNGLTGGPITGSGSLSVLANTGIVANTTGTFVNATYIASIASNSATFANSSVTNTFTVGTASYFVSNGNLGVGSASPRAKLDVSGDIWTDWSDRFMGTVYLTGTQYRLGVKTIVNTRDTQIWSQSADGTGVSGVTIYTGATPSERVRVDVSGNVGIGNTAPNAKLQVTGTANVSGNVAIAGITTLSANVVLGTTTITANGGVGTAGQVLTSGATGNVYWSTPQVGDITAVTAGNGLTGGGTSGDVTLDIGAGNGITVAADSVAVTEGVGLAVNTTGVHVKANNGITANSTGTFVTQGTGLVVNATGVHVNDTYIATLTANNTNNLGGVAAASYVQNTDSRTLSGNLNFTGTNTFFTTGWFVGANVYANTTAVDVGNTIVSSINLTLGGQVTANGGVGTAGQVLTSGAAGNVYWSTVTAGAGVNTDAQYTWTNNQSFSVGANAIILTNATQNWIWWNTTGVAAPTTTTRSAGTKLALYPSLSATQVDYAIGIESNHLWFSTDNVTTGTKWYANTTNYMTANVAGLYHTGLVNAVSFTAGATYGGATAGMSSNATIVGVSSNTTVNGSITNSLVQVANSTGNAQIVPTSITVQNSTVNTVIGLQSVIIQSNTTVNGSITNSLIQIANSTSNVQISPVSVLVRSNTTVNSTVNSSIVQVSNSTSTANLNALSLTIGTSVVNSTVHAVGANVYTNATTVFVGNSTVNASIVSTTIQVSNSTSNVQLVPTTISVGNSTVNAVANLTAVTAHVQHANRPTIAFNYTVANTVNSLIVGPYQVNTGFTLTVETGARLVIV